MNVAIIGGLGFIGTNLYKLLSKNKNYKITIIDNFKIKNNIKNFKCKIIKKDITKINNLNKLLKNFEKVINLAGQTGVLESFEKPVFSITNNIIGFSNIIESLKNSKCKVLINASTGGAIYGESKNNCKENDPKNPKSIYGLTKLFNENYSSILSSKINFQIIHLRFSNVYGEFSLHKKSLIHTTIKNCLSCKTTNIFGDGSQKRNFIYVNDLVKIINKCFYLKSGNYSIAAQKSYTVKQFIEIISSIDSRATFKYFKFNEGEVKIVNISNKKIKNKLNLNKNSFTSFKNSILKTYIWYKKNLKNNN